MGCTLIGKQIFLKKLRNKYAWPMVYVLLFKISFYEHYHDDARCCVSKGGTVHSNVREAAGWSSSLQWLL